MFWGNGVPTVERRPCPLQQDVLQIRVFFERRNKQCFKETASSFFRAVYIVKFFRKIWQPGRLHDGTSHTRLTYFLWAYCNKLFLLSFATFLLYKVFGLYLYTFFFYLESSALTNTRTQSPNSKMDPNTKYSQSRSGGRVVFVWEGREEMNERDTKEMEKIRHGGERFLKLGCKERGGIF